MANPALIVRVAANLAELKANLAEGRSSIETTTAAMGKLAASFSGDKIIQSAHNVVAAVNQIGGATKLTEAEQARVNATLEKALEKYRALGREAPAGMQQLADETKQADVASSGLTETVKQLALGFAAMFTARAAYNFVAQTVAEASALKDLSQQTHISVEELQILAGGMSEFGVDADTLGKGLFTLSRKVAGGDESVAAALHTMGLSLQAVDGLQGRELFLKIMDGLSTLQGGLKDDTASEIFGSRLGMAMAGASTDIRGAMEAWETLNHVASTESVDAMDKYGESIDRANKSLSAIATNMIGPVAEGFNVVVDAATRAGAVQTFWAMVKDGVGAGGPLGAWIAGTHNLADLLDDMNVKTEAAVAKQRALAAATGAQTAEVDKRSQSERFLAGIEADAAAALTPVQTAHLVRLKELNALTAANAAGVGVSASQYAAYTDAMKASTDAMAQAVKDAAESDKVLAAAAADTMKQLGAQAKATADADNHAAALASTARFTSEVIGVMGDEADDTAGKIRRLSGDMQDLEEYAENQRKGGSFAQAEMSQAEYDAVGGAAKLAAIEASYRANPGRRAGASGSTGLGTNDARGYAAMLEEQRLYAQLKAYKPGYATGVENAPGGWSTVGERGPETMYVPQGATIYPSGSGGGSRDTRPRVIQLVVSGRVLAQVVDDETMQRQRNIGERW